MAESPTVHGDPTRIAAGVITGIGFLGGGAILKLGRNIRGLTTSAIIFTTSAMGMAFGAGLYFPTLITFFIVMFILFTMDKLEKKFFPATRTKVVIIQILVNDSKLDFTDTFLSIMKKYGFIVHDINSNFLPKENQMQLSYTVKTPDKIDAVKIAKEFSEVTKDLLSFSIIDK